MYYRLYFSSVDEANEFIDRLNGLGCDWNPVHLDTNDKPVLQFACSAATYEKVYAAYMGE